LFCRADRLTRARGLQTSGTPGPGSRPSAPRNQVAGWPAWAGLRTAKPYSTSAALTTGPRGSGCRFGPPRGDALGAGVARNRRRVRSVSSSKTSGRGTRATGADRPPPGPITYVRKGTCVMPWVIAHFHITTSDPAYFWQLRPQARPDGQSALPLPTPAHPRPVSATPAPRSERCWRGGVVVCLWTDNLASAPTSASRDSPLPPARRRPTLAAPCSSPWPPFGAWLCARHDDRQPPPVKSAHLPSAPCPTGTRPEDPHTPSFRSDPAGMRHRLRRGFRDWPWVGV